VAQRWVWVITPSESVFAGVDVKRAPAWGGERVSRVCVWTPVIEYRVAMKIMIMMTVMDGAEAERESISSTSSVINNVTGIAIYGGSGSFGSSVIHRSGDQEQVYWTSRVYKS
jgi:hypothetical protein